MHKVLINFAHPAKKHSKINTALRKAIEDIEGVTVNDLYSNYPDFLIDVKREQRLCEENDIIIFQHPLYWYSTPAIMKEWQDLVLEHGWAYGSEGDALKDKLFFQVISAGGDEETYHKDGYNRFTIKELTSSYQATAHLCKMTWIPPFCVFGAHRGLEEERVRHFSQEYRKAVIALRDGTLDIRQVRQDKYLNEDLDSIIRKTD